MKLIAYVLLGLLMSVFNVGVMENPLAFVSILACVLLIDYAPT